MNPKPDLKARVVPPRNGIAWLVQSVALLRAQPGRLLFIAVMLQIMMGLTQVPLVGFLLILSVPAFSAGMLQAIRVTAEGGRPAPTLLFSPVAQRKRALHVPSTPGNVVGDRPTGTGVEGT